MEAANAGGGWAEGTSCEAEGNQGGSAAGPAMPTGFGDWHVATRGLSLGSSGTRVVGLLDSSEMGPLGCEKSAW